MQVRGVEPRGNQIKGGMGRSRRQERHGRPWLSWCLSTKDNHEQ